MKLRGFPWRILTRNRYDQLISASDEKEALLKEKAMLQELPEAMAGFFLKNIPQSCSQNLQDLFFLWEMNRKKKGFFLEIGACDGVLFSNTLLLEKKYGWNGILVEPGRCWHKALSKNRRCAISHAFIAGQSGNTVCFNETPEPEYSGAQQLADQDHNADRRRGGRQYDVPTLSPGDLLRQHQAPTQIDFLSIDVEGGEFDILSHFPFDRHNVGAICCEHNFTAQRKSIHSLLSDHGYIRKYENFSDYDDWYFRP